MPDRAMLVANLQRHDRAAVAHQANGPASRRRAEKRLVVAVLEEMHLLGHADAGAYGFMKPLVDNHRKAHRLFAVLDLDFDVDLDHLKDRDGRIRRFVSSMLGIPGMVVVFHDMILSAVALAAHRASKGRVLFRNGQSRIFRTLLDYL